MILLNRIDPQTMYYYLGKGRDKGSRYVYKERIPEPAPPFDDSNDDDTSQKDSGDAAMGKINSTQATVIVRRLSPFDWQLLKELRHRALTDSPDSFGSTLSETLLKADEYWQLRVSNENVAHFVVFQQTSDCESGDLGCPIGTAVGAPCNSDKADDKTGSAGLFGMWVDASARGLGVGAALVDAVKNWARDKAYRRLVLEVADANTPAIALYRRCGFVPTGITGAMDPPREYITEHELACEL